MSKYCITASGDPAAWMRFPISGVPWISCDDLWEWVPPERDDIAESIDDVRGAARAISIRCLGAVAAIGGRVLVGEPPGGFEVRTGSETLLEEAFVSFIGRGNLLLYLCKQRGISVLAAASTLIGLRGSIQRTTLRTCRSFSRRLTSRPDAPWEIEAPHAGCRTDWRC